VNKFLRAAKNELLRLLILEPHYFHNDYSGGKMENGENLKGGAVFIFIVILLALAPLLWLALFGYQMQNLQAFIVASIFLLFLILPFSFDFIKYMMPSGTGYGAAALSFTVGAALAAVLNWNALFQPSQQAMSIFSVPTNFLLSTISSQLPLFWFYFTNTFGAAVSEEMLFLITLPAILFIVLDFAGKQVEVFSNKYLQIAIVAAIAGVLFAVFHIGNLALTGFITSAIIFRAFLIGIVHGERLEGLVPFITIVPSFAIGFHLFNNMLVMGISNVLQAFIAEPLGILLIVFLGSTFLFGFLEIFRLFRR